MAKKNKRDYIFFKLDPEKPMAQLPRAQRKGDVGFDIHSAVDDVIEPGKTKLVSTGVILASMPSEIQGAPLFMKIEGRSGLALKGIFPVGGIIDPTYRGEIGVILHNSSEEEYTIEAGDRIAQLILYSIYTGHDVIFAESSTVSKTNRGDKGYGSSGK